MPYCELGRRPENVNTGSKYGLQVQNAIQGKTNNIGLKFIHTYLGSKSVLFRTAVLCANAVLHNAAGGRTCP